MLQGKKILLGVCGSIAAYKAAILVRGLVKNNAEVKVIMTAAAQDFITPLTLSTLSKNPVLTSFTTEQGNWHNHVELGLWADLMLVAPVSAYTLSKFAQGICRDLLTAVYLSARCPVFLAPAMDLDMYQHPSTQKNLQLLKKYGNTIIEPESGELASGLTGIGRMAEPESIITQLDDYFQPKSSLVGKHVLVTAGPTAEAIDPVRYITNASSGKMGFAIAQMAANMGAKVSLVTGPTFETLSHEKVTVTVVRSAHEMYKACMRIFPNVDVAIMAAAVADYTPKNPSQQKIKKTGDTLTLELTKTEDIAASLGKIKRPDQMLVGFALETNDEVSNARKKLISKNLDFIVLNSLNDAGTGFGFDTNKIKILDHNSNHIQEFTLKSKREVARDILKLITNKLHA